MEIGVASIHTLISGYGNLYSDLLTLNSPYSVTLFMRLPWFSTDSAASSFSSKTKLAFFLGFLTPLMKSAIDDCRGIRNVYAHSDSPEAGRSNKKYISRKQALVSRDSELTKRAIEHIRSLVKRPINRTDDEVAVTAVMVQICDNLDCVAAINKLHGPSSLPKVIPAFYGYADAPSEHIT